MLIKKRVYKFKLKNKKRKKKDCVIFDYNLWNINNRESEILGLFEMM